MGRFDRSLFHILSVYLLALALYGRDFSYLHLQVAGISIYVGELALILGLAHSFLKERAPLLTARSHAGFIAALIGYLVWGMARTALSLKTGWSEFGLVQIIRDSCVWYQAVWAWVGLRWSVREWRQVISMILTGIGLSQFASWMAAFSANNEALRPHFNPAGNEVVSSLFPFGHALWSRRRAILLTSTFGAALFLQLLYLKRNWVFSVFAIAFSAMVWITVSGVRTKRVRDFVVAGIAGFVIAFSTFVFWPGVRAETVFFQNQTYPGEAMNLDVILGSKNLDRWLFHGEIEYDPTGRVTGRMAWRMHLWKQAWAGFLESPLIGRGFGPKILKTQANGLPAEVGGKWITAPHNSYLTIAYRMGAIGLVFFFSMIGMAATTFLVRIRENSAESKLAFAAFASIAFYSIFNVGLENPQSGTWFWLFLGAVVGQSVVKPTPKRDLSG